MHITSTLHSSHVRSREQGGIVIIVALMMLALLAVSAFGFSRTVVRQIGISGNVFQAGRADAAADAGLDWFLAWEGDSQKVTPTGTPSGQAKNLIDSINSTYATGLDLGRDLSSTSYPLAWKATVGTPNGLVMQGANVDGSMTQAFDLRLVCLGKDDGGQSGGGETTRGNPSGGTNVKTNTQQLYAWEVTSTGQALLPGDSWRFQSIRSAKVVIRPKS